jgi:hypothetical protein
MTSFALAQLLLRQPLQQFTLHVLGWDQTVYVKGPEQVHHEQGNRVIIIDLPDGGEVIVDLDLVGLIEVYKGR